MAVYPGKRFGMWTVRGTVRVKVRGTLQKQLRCECDCGTKRNMPLQYLTRKNGPSTHCGCQSPRAEYPYERVCWHSMHLRTEYEKHVAYAQYGGRGIKVCERWQKSREDGMGFQNFLEDMGPCPQPHKMTVDRKDNDKGYEKDNCRWATKKEQRANQRPRS